MPYAVVIWRRGNSYIDIAGLKPEDLEYLEKIPCLSNRFEIDREGFIRFGPKNTGRIPSIQPTVVLTGLEVLGFRVVTTTAVFAEKNPGASAEYSWTMRREFNEPEPQD